MIMALTLVMVKGPRKTFGRSSLGVVLFHLVLSNHVLKSV